MILLFGKVQMEVRNDREEIVEGHFRIKNMEKYEWHWLLDIIQGDGSSYFIFASFRFDINFES